jgi:cellulose synthase/poly-beta-1,6-N-acetylglucosamine synthase-like glycosyltransferase
MYTFTLVIQVILLVTFFWACSTIFVGMITKKRKAMPARENKKFAIVICAHNEERVLDKLLKSLISQHYDSADFHIFLLADHCKDGTVAIGKRYEQVTVLERTSGPRSGKGAVLEWGMEIFLRQYADAYTHVIIFDADNVAEPDFLTAMNESFCNGARLVMGNRLPLNPYDNLISEWYSMYWLTVDKLYCLPRYNVYMPAIISGTGFGFDISLIRKDGWHTVTKTEDMEFSMQMNFKGIFPEYQDKAHFYDEQPVMFHTMISQLRRWCTGNFQIATTYWKVWLRYFKINFDMRLIDNFIPILLCTIFGFYFITNVCWLVYNAVEGLPLFAAKDIIWWIFLYILSVRTGYLSVKKSGLSVKKMLPGILTCGFYCILITLVAVSAFFFPSRTWVPIAHTHTGGPETK